MICRGVSNWRQLVLGAAALALLLAVSALAAASARAEGTVSVSVGGQGSASGPGIDCTQSGGPDCSETYADSEECEFDPEIREWICFPIFPSVTLTAGADSNGFQFNGWTGCDGGTGRDCEMTVDGNRGVSASFRDVQVPSLNSPTPSSSVQRGTIILGAIASDNSGTVTRVEFRVRGDLVGMDTTAPYEASFNTASKADGAAAITATAFDPAGNSSTSQSTVTVDNTPPTLNITAGPNGQTFGAGTTQSWSFSPGDATSGVQSVQCSLVATGSAASFGACSGGTGAHSATNLPDGDYTFTVRVRDNGGLETLQSRTFSVDGTAPTLGVTSGPDGNAFTEGAAQAWSFSAADAHLQSVECSVGGTGSTPAYGPCSGGNASHSVNGLAPGNYVFTVRARDSVGNETVVTRSFSVVPASGTGGTGGTGGTPGGGENGVPAITDAQISSLLASDLAAAARALSRQRLAKLAKKGSLGLRFNALMAGRFTLAFKGAATKQKAARSIVIAKGSRSVTSAGAYTVTLKLTRAGKRLLRGGRRVKGKLSATFGKAGGGSLTGATGVTLKRR